MVRGQIVYNSETGEVTFAENMTDAVLNAANAGGVPLNVVSAGEQKEFTQEKAPSGTRDVVAEAGKPSEEVSIDDIPTAAPQTPAIEETVGDRKVRQ
jgi:hypothetical protein